MPTDQQINELKALLSEGQYLDDQGDIASYLKLEPWSIEKEPGKTPLVLLPKTTDEIASILKYCNKHKIPVFPQGGRTGLVGASYPDSTDAGICINMELMNAIFEISEDSIDTDVEAGVTINALKDAAKKHDLLFPMKFAVNDRVQLGATAMTDAGGMNAIRYGTMRDLIVGLTFVTATGEIIELCGTHKDTTGERRLMQTIIGSEGTLGIITHLKLKLFPLPKIKNSVLVGVNSPKEAQELFTLARKEYAEHLNVFEIINNTALKLGLEATGKNDIKEAPLYILLELTSDNMAAIAKYNIILSGSEDWIWEAREAIGPAGRQAFGDRVIIFDPVVPPHMTGKFMQELESKIQNKYQKQLEILQFAHFGDGNIHLHIGQPKETHSDFNILKQKAEIENLVYELVKEMGGSPIAEHGIGTKNKDLITQYMDPATLKYLQNIKKDFDPNNIMNPSRGVPL